MPKIYTEIENLIITEVKPTESNSAEQTYERLERVAGNLPVIDVPQDLSLETHFVEEAQICDFRAHLAGCKEILDVGCGDGWPLLRLAPFFESVTGIDASGRRVATSLANAERLGIKNIRVLQMSATALDFADDSFDAVVSAFGVEQCPDPYQALREVFRVLKPGGKLRLVFEAYETAGRVVTEQVFLTENEESLGYHYVLRHQRPPWERNYLVKFTPTPEIKEEFRRLKDLIARLGSVPTQVPEIGKDFLEKNLGYVKGGSWYELEHFTSTAMKETLEEIGFVDVEIIYYAGTFARKLWGEIKDEGMSATQLKAVCRGLAELAKEMQAPAGSGEPVKAIKPK
ncbi:MAG: class I SAM-dependent methyltransferase [candidate division WOR-3 bacterium]